MSLATDRASSITSDSIGLPIGNVITRIPCMARGLPSDHNSMNAYFVITDSMKHGQHVVCSYPQCRDKGTKFRYCVYCKTPAAKRSFPAKHSHPEHTQCRPVTTEAQKPLKKRKEFSTQASKVSREEFSTSNNESSSNVGSVFTMRKRSSSSKRGSSSKKTKRSHSSERKNDVKSKTMIQWMSLLERRPSVEDSDNMSAWLMSVLSTSKRGREFFNRQQQEQRMTSSKQKTSAKLVDNGSSSQSSSPREITSSSEDSLLT